MAKQVSVNIFDIQWDEKRGTQKLSDTFDEFASLPLDRRWRDDVRLELVKQSVILGFPVYMLDFVKKREVGPGRMADATAIKDIKLDRGENFGEETAALYVPKKKWLLVLHNQAGMGPSRIASYCNALDPGNSERHFDYEAQPKLDAAVMKKLNAMRGISTISITATMDALNAAEAGAGTSFAEASRPAKPNRLSFQLMANPPYKKGRFLDGILMKKLIDGLLRGGEDVTKLEVTGESDEVGGKDMLIDLLHHKVKRKFSADELKIVAHRYTVESRWDMLDRCFRGWHNAL